MHTRIMPRKNVASGLLALAVGAGVALAWAPARAGHGGSPQALASAIQSNSPDAIAAELERSEYLVCAACVDYVLPLVDHPDAFVRQAAGWWLARRATVRQVVTDMLGRLSQPDSTKARNAADVLGELKLASTVPALGAALSNPVYSGEARAAMAKALGNIRSDAAVPYLVAVLGDGDPTVRAGAVGALRQFPASFSGFSSVTPLLADGDAGVRLQAVLTLGALKAKGTAPAVAQILSSDGSVDVRRKAAWALGQMGASASDAGPALQQATSSDASPLVRSLAQAAISHLTP